MLPVLAMLLVYWCLTPKNGIGNYTFKCSQGAYNEVAQSQHDYPYSLEPFSEHVACHCAWVFLGSVVDMVADTGCSFVPGTSEAFVQVNWNLPLGADAQTALFARMRLDFDRETTGIPLEKEQQIQES